MKPKQLVKDLKPHIIPIVLIASLSYFVWHKIFNQTLLGEGFHYFDAGHRRFDTLNTFFGSDTFPKLLFGFLPSLFGDNFLLYIVLQFLVMLILYSTLYLVIFKITESKIVGLTSSVFFLSSYVGSFTMMGTGAYDRFMERVPNLIILFLSFYLLNKYLKTGFRKTLFVSYLLFFIGNFLAHHSIFLVPIFIFIPFAYFIANMPNIKNPKRYLTTTLAISALFFFTAIVINSFETLRPSRGVIEFISTDSTLLKKVFYQLPTLFFPLGLIKYLGKILEDSYPFVKTVGLLLFPTLTILILGVILIKKRLASNFPLYLASILSLPVVSFLNIYAYDSSPNPLRNFGEDRVYFISSIYSAIILALLLRALFKKAEPIYRAISTIVIFLYTIYNSQLIWKSMEAIQYKSEALRRFLEQVERISPQFKEKVFIVAPPEFQWPIPLIRQKYNNPSIDFISFNQGWDKDIKSNDKDNIFILDYDYEVVPGEGTDVSLGKIIDKTQDYRAGREVTPLNP